MEFTKESVSNVLARGFDFAMVDDARKAGMDAHADAFIKNKKALYDLFRQSEYWHEDMLALVFPEHTERSDIDANVAMDKFDGMMSALRLAGYSDAYHTICSSCIDIVNPTVTNTDIELFSKFGMRVSAGTKKTKVFSRLFASFNIPKDNEFWKKLQAYFDAISPFSLRRKFVLSMHPCDYLLSAYGISWSSCHIPNGDLVNCYLDHQYGGQSKAGTMSYMTDGVTMVGYTLPADANFDDTTWMQKKYTRQLFHFDLETNNFMQARLYPYTEDEVRRKQYRKIVEGEFGKLIGNEDKWVVTKRTLDFFVQASGTLNYPDFAHDRFLCKAVYQKSKAALDGDEEEVDEDTPYRPDVKAKVGSAPICIGCGDTRYSNDAGTFLCNKCLGVYFCKRCGCMVNADEAVEIDDDYYCPDCVVRCDFCGGWVSKDDYMYINDQFVCEHCVNEHGGVVTCRQCGDVILADDATYDDDDKAFCCEDCMNRYTQRHVERSHVAIGAIPF